MKIRALLECTIDTANPVPELADVITAVLSALPTAGNRLAVLYALHREIDAAIMEYETQQTEVGASA